MINLRKTLTPVKGGSFKRENSDIKFSCGGDENQQIWRVSLIWKK